MKQYTVDAFTERVFAGNPAAVCVLEQWLPADLMLRIAEENHLSETAFVVKEGEAYHLRWFTPTGEIDLCGHATLACSHVLFTFYEPDKNLLTFKTMSGSLSVRRAGDLYEMSFPAYELRPVEVTKEMEEAIGVTPQAAYMGRDLLCILEDAEAVQKAAPDLEKVKTLDGLLLHITARGRETDCVSRSFGPKCGIPEDPVCGSGHCHIIPYWSDRLQKKELVAYQASGRGGTLYCSLDGGRVKLAGRAALYAVSELFIGEPARGL